MFTIDSTIDAVQTGKKTLVNTMVLNESVKTTMHDFIDTQTEYTKKMTKVSTDVATVLSQEMIKAFQDATKFDYTKFGEGIMKAYMSNTNKK